MAAQVTHMQPGAAAALLKGPEREQVLVLDVRDEDFEGGHIKGCVNVESEHFREASSIDSVIDTHLLGKCQVLVHCMFSQQRGPRCATRLAARMAERNIKSPSIHVLRGGFLGFAQKFGNDPDLVEDYNPAIVSRYY